MMNVGKVIAGGGFNGNALTILHHHRWTRALIFLLVKGEMMDILNIRLKNVYKEFCSYRLTQSTANAKW